MGPTRILILSSITLVCLLQSRIKAAETVLSTVLTPTDTSKEKLSRQGRSYYYDERYAIPRPLYERLEYDRYDRCGRCDDRDDRNDRDYDRPSRDRYDDDRRVSHRPTYGNRQDRNKNQDSEEDDKKYSNDRHNTNKNGTDDEMDDKKRPYDDKDRPSGGRRDRDRDRDRHRNSYDDRDRYRPDYYDRFLRDPYRERVPYEDPYRERRPLYERYPDRYDDGFGGRVDGYGYPGYRRPAYDDRYDRGGSDDIYGGYGPGAGRGPHDSFRPWDETYRGQAGWDAGGRGYYFASGRPEAAPASSWGRPSYNTLQDQYSGWQNVGSVGYNRYPEPADYRGSFGAQDTGYRQDFNAGYGRPSGWQNVGERRPYRDQSGVSQLDKRPNYDQAYGQNSNRGQQSYGQQTYGQSTYQQKNIGTNGYGQTSSTTPGTSYLYQREDEAVTPKSTDETTKPPS